jgi:hypothetical protein
MTTSDKKKLVLLVLLVVGGAASYVWTYRTPADTSAAASDAAKSPVKGAPIKPGQEGEIKIALLKGIGTDDVGRRNLFQFRPKPVPAPPPAIRPTTVPTTFVPAPPPGPPPVIIPPFKPFRYEGFSTVKDGGKLLASVTESGNTYTVREGECLLGNYCISKLTETMVEIEDLQQKRKQTFMRAQ